MFEVDPKLALDAAVLAAIKKPRRLHNVFSAVAKRLPVEKREVKAALQRLRKSGAVWCDLRNGEWHANKPARKSR
jgi:DNA-binding IclR family transcriptional regulator